MPEVSIEISLSPQPYPYKWSPNPAVSTSRIQQFLCTFCLCLGPPPLSRHCLSFLTGLSALSPRLSPWQTFSNDAAELPSSIFKYTHLYFEDPHSSGWRVSLYQMLLSKIRPKTIFSSYLKQLYSPSTLNTLHLPKPFKTFAHLFPLLVYPH